MEMKEMEAILDVLKSRSKAMDIYEISEALEQPIENIELALAKLISAGTVVMTKKGKYALPEDMGLISARTLVLRNGAQVARPLHGGADMIIRERGELLPMLDDLILVRPEPHYAHSEGMGHCQLVSITQRAHETFIALLSMVPMNAGSKKSSKKPIQISYMPQLRPLNSRLGTDIQLVGELMGAHDGDTVQVRVTKMPKRNSKLHARIEWVLGNAEDIRVQLRAIALQQGLKEHFSEDTVQQAASIPSQVEEADLVGRNDFRKMMLFTIDGEDAQDFDDAISLEPCENGVRLGVHIADVSHYVRPQTPIDREALERGTSVYLPGLTLPMLPEVLSNHMCSLMPGVDRLSLSLIMEIRDGKVVDHLLAPSVIHSCARLTYEQVNRMLEGQSSDIPEELHGTLKDMVGLANMLHERRHTRGSIDFDMPETAFTLDTGGYPIDVRARSRGESERMIEEFMLLANETVAELAQSTDLPFLYRVHEKPDSEGVHALEAFLHSLGINVRINNNPSPARFQQILADAQGKGEAQLIKQVMLRSLKRAEYSESPKGHFGLATQDYCHFTAPIRRYPDLVVHRMLKLLLAGKAEAFAQHEKHMPELASHCSFCEQRAVLAERDADALLKVHYMLHQIGEEFSGIVTGVTSWGVYVTLENTVEGLVHQNSLSGDWWYDKEKHTLKGYNKQSIRLGDAVNIRVDRVNIALSQVDFSLVP